MDSIILGRNIHRVRRDKGLSSDKLSELCAITPAYLRQVEAGSKTPSLPLFVMLCNKLNVSPAYLSWKTQLIPILRNWMPSVRVLHPVSLS